MELQARSRWLVIVAVPVLSYVVGLVALPRPTGVLVEQRDFDRSTLGTAFSTTPTTPRHPHHRRSIYHR